jgi:hypothetical protein
MQAKFLGKRVICDYSYGNFTPKMLHKIILVYLPNFST